MTATRGFVVPAGGGKRLDSPTPGRSFSLKLLGHETDESIMMFEETLPAGTASLFHLHHDSDEVAWVLSGEFAFKIGDEVTAGGPGTCAFMPRDVPHAWKNTGSETARARCFSTPRPLPAASLRIFRSAARATPTNTANSSSATAGKSSAQILFEVGLCAGRAMPSRDQVAVSATGFRSIMSSTGVGRPRSSSRTDGAATGVAGTAHQGATVRHWTIQPFGRMSRCHRKAWHATGGAELKRRYSPSPRPSPRKRGEGEDRSHRVPSPGETGKRTG